MYGVRGSGRDRFGIRPPFAIRLPSLSHAELLHVRDLIPGTKHQTPVISLLARAPVMRNTTRPPWIEWESYRNLITNSLRFHNLPADLDTFRRPIHGIVKGTTSHTNTHGERFRVASGSVDSQKSKPPQLPFWYHAVWWDLIRAQPSHHGRQKRARQVLVSLAVWQASKNRKSL